MNNIQKKAAWLKEDCDHLWELCRKRSFEIMDLKNLLKYERKRIKNQMNTIRLQRETKAQLAAKIDELTKQLEDKS